MTRIVICRHGNTFDKGDVITRVGSRTDMPLSISGINQAKGLADHFSPETSDFSFKSAFCSSLLRTYQTSDFILTSGHPVKELKILQFLTEIDYGIDENKPESDVVARLGEKAIEQWDNDAIPPDGWKVNPPEIISAWKTFFADHHDGMGDILVVTSNGIARFALDAVDEIATDAPRKLRTAAYGIIEIKNGMSKVTAWDKRIS
ncbi:histidine phosphatase family protein [Hellea sp.]|nr:histidine phosphatase family protein [Hellea sp.]